MRMYNPLAPSYRRDPYPALHRHRREAPILYFPPAGSYFLFRYADIRAVLRDERFITVQKEGFNFLPGVEPAGPLSDAQDHWLVLQNPPHHTRMRNILNKSFTPKVIQGLAASVADIADDLLRDLRGTGVVDLVEAFTGPLPMMVIADQLGVPRADRGMFKRWSDDICAAMDPFTGLAFQYEGNRTAREMAAYMTEVIEDRRLEPRDDLISLMVAAEEEGDRLSNDELLATCMLLLFAGNETTTNLLGNSLLGLLKHPDQLRALRDDPSLIDAGVEELIRYDTPSHSGARTAAQDLELGGYTVQKGQRVILVFAAGNRDPEVFPEPDRLDMTREDTRHIAFGSGHHFCLGAHLARLEVKVALPKLLAHLPHLELGGRVTWRRNLTLRGPKRLPLRYRAAV